MFFTVSDLAIGSRVLFKRGSELERGSVRYTGRLIGKCYCLQLHYSTLIQTVCFLGSSKSNNNISLYYYVNNLLCHYITCVVYVWYSLYREKSGQFLGK